MKKLIVAAAVLASVPAFATTYNFTSAAEIGFTTKTGYSAIMSIDDSSKMLNATITTYGNTLNGGLALNCCTNAGTQPAIVFSTSVLTAGTYTFSVDLSNLASYDAGFLALGNGTTAYTTVSSAYSALLSGVTTVANVNSGASIARVAAWTGATPNGANFSGNVIPTPVPEPATYAMLALGLGLVALRARKQAR